MVALHTSPPPSYPKALQPTQTAIAFRERIQDLSDDTFGYQWAVFLDRQPLSQRTNSRQQQLYAGVYLLTGYGVDPMGAAEVHAFLLGTKGDVMNLIRCLILLVTVYQQRLTTAHSSLTLESVKRRLYKAYQRGKNSCFDFDTWRPECLWDLSPAYVRRWFGISP